VKQILQNARTGGLELVDVPAPAVGPGQMLVRNVYSVMSPGTEKLAMDFARKTMLGKARSRPDLVKQVIRKVRQEGPLPTYRTVVNRLDAPQPLGYASAGIVEQVGPGVSSFAPGDRAACAGAGYANHAEMIVVPENLTAHVPEELSLDRAAFATLGAIAMQGLRIGDPTLGEVVAVVGLGLIGQLTVQLLRANGCRVFGLDLAPQRVAQGLEQGMDWGAPPDEDHAHLLAHATGGHGVDLAIVTAASDSSAPIQLAADLCRQKGRVVAVGATAMDLDRRTFYDKELELRMSMSYGPGRYDRQYEELGLDYPIAYVRWTEQRNLQAFVDLAARGSIDPMTMDLEKVEFDKAIEVYEALAKGERKALAAIFEYETEVDSSRSLPVATHAGRTRRVRRTEDVGIAMIGAGTYAKGVLLPILQNSKGISRHSIVTSTGPSAQRTAERFGFEACSTDPDEVFADDKIDLVFITTRHDSHASLAEAALRAEKSVWLEKPIGITPEEALNVVAAAEQSEGLLMVGYNRRFSPHARAVRSAFEGRRGAMSMQYVVAAGSTPGGTWLTDPQVGGGRIVGEVCHFVDLCTFLVGQVPTGVYARSLGRDPEVDDSMMAQLSYPDGSVANISYLANANSELPKERWEVHADGKSAICENFRVTSLPNGKKLRGVNQDKGQETAIREALAGCRLADPRSMSTLISPTELLSTSITTHQMLASMATGAAVPVDAGGPRE
jgi:predicted dehydrogenase/threonine dehydrogenase-like Zn-dependent dehydrogenase